MAASTTAPTPSANVINPRPQSPSFNCAAATTQSESAICRDPGLCALDRDLAALYSTRRQGLPDASSKSLRDSQRRWLAERNKCGSDVGCLATRYRERIVWLRKS
ncbi:lysozyme inhibitor LprI family protein [uncultured Thiodictyon sp.]|uniref:lysozyme inhibitor LprI family protein n=1 Tax=uncultured Thiodictyon sp. TaxID=1846217 RepID=UPI003459383B